MPDVAIYIKNLSAPPTPQLFTIHYYLFTKKAPSRVLFYISFYFFVYGSVVSYSPYSQPMFRALTSSSSAGFLRNAFL